MAVSANIVLLLLPTIILVCMTEYGFCQNDTDNLTGAASEPVQAASGTESLPLAAPAPNPEAARRRYRSKKKQVVEAIRKKGKNWVAAVNPDFENITDFRILLGAEQVPLPEPGRQMPAPPGTPQVPSMPGRPGAHPGKRVKLPPKRARGNETESVRHRRSINLPSRYDVRWDYPECTSVGSVRYQYRCSSCWAVTAASAMSDRHCIYNYQRTGQIYISPTHIISCVPKGCLGGKEWDAYDYWIRNGLVSGGTAYAGANQPDGCLPYPYGIDRTPDSCPTSCSTSNSKTFQEDKTYGGDYSEIYTRSVETIQKEIFTYGPVVAFFTVYDDFFYYKAGVYEHVNGSFVGYHLTKLIGWGTEGGVDYWQAVNTWGTKWGINGLFKIRRGDNTVGIEQRISSVFPKEAVPGP